MDYRHGGVESLDPWLGRCVSKEKEKRGREGARSFVSPRARAHRIASFSPSKLSHSSLWPRFLSQTRVDTTTRLVSRARKEEGEKQMTKRERRKNEEKRRAVKGENRETGNHRVHGEGRRSPRPG